MSSDIGMLGLGVMGQNFALNLERNGFTVSVFERVVEVTNAYMRGFAAGKHITPAYSVHAFVESLSRPRRIMMLVKAGEPVDITIQQLLPFLEKGDILIDGGNSHFLDTERRGHDLEAKGISYIGMGVSGGEEGALKGPSLMPGGNEKAYRAIEPILTKVAAKALEDREPCVTYIGPGGSGHYVKMVHNGIEYGDMQLIAESYDLLKRALGFTASDFQSLFTDWNKGKLSSFLIETTAMVFGKIDSETGAPLVDMILDTAGQKGTGKWTIQDAANLGAAVSTIAAALDARNLSALKDERVRASRILKAPSSAGGTNSRQKLTDAVRDALYASKICSYAQGLALLGRASQEYSYSLNLAAIAKIWRAGCIIRAKLLNEIMKAFERDRALPNLLVDREFQSEVNQAQDGWRFALRTAIELGVPMPAMGASLAYYDSYRSERLPANLIQAQRDFFGAHTFERIDKPGSFHETWVSK
ncbi:MAG TPA: NADP-dependent phosphogluconate dehydrogenase [Bacteroidota bacterium]|nr:NADP-dependent phosphogluconate dehydrogenase [Bacteroidota bacterium]